MMLEEWTDLLADVGLLRDDLVNYASARALFVWSNMTVVDEVRRRGRGARWTCVLMSCCLLQICLCGWFVRLIDVQLHEKT